MAANSGPSRSRSLALGLLALFLSVACQRQGTTESEPLRRVDKILVILVDCMRADRVSASSGYPLPTTPTLDAIAEDGISFSRAYAQANWTKPSIASLFSGLYVRNHGTTVGSVLAKSDGEALKGLASYPLAPEIPLLAESFRDLGFQTGGFVENIHLDKTQGFDRGFGAYRRASPASAWMRRWLSEVDSAAPVLGYLHLIGPHDPYDHDRPDSQLRKYQEAFVKTPSEIDFKKLAYKAARDLSEEDIARARELYDAELAYYDGEQIDGLISWLKNQGLYNDYLIVVTADHGEELYDHGGWAHGHSLYEELLRVPLIFKLPASWVEGTPPAGTVFDEVVELIDLYPTLLDLAGAEPPASIDGESIAPLLLGKRASNPASYAIAEFGRDVPTHVLAATIVRADEKLVVRYSIPYETRVVPRLAELDGTQENFRIYSLDGFDQRDVTRQPTRDQRRGARELQNLLVEVLGRSPEMVRRTRESVPLSDEDRAQLIALGYLDG